MDSIYKSIMPECISIKSTQSFIYHRASLSLWLSIPPSFYSPSVSRFPRRPGLRLAPFPRSPSVCPPQTQSHPRHFSRAAESSDTMCRSRSQSSNRGASFVFGVSGHCPYLRCWSAVVYAPFFGSSYGGTWIWSDAFFFSPAFCLLISASSSWVSPPSTPRSQRIVPQLSWQELQIR